MNTLADDPWVLRLADGAPDRSEALEELRVYLRRGLTRALTHRYGGAVDIDDVVQLTLLKILDSLATYRQESRFTTWAMSIGVRIGISQLRRKYYRDVSLHSEAESPELRIDPRLLASAPADAEPQRQSLFLLLQRLIDETLTERQRLAVRGMLEGLPVEEIADRLNSNRNAIYKLIHDARMRLKEGFQAAGVSADEISETLA